MSRTFGELGIGVTILLLGVFDAVLLATRLGPLNSVWSIDQGVRLEHIESLLSTRFHSIATVYPGDRIDPKHEFTPLLNQYLYRDGRSYSMFSLAFSVLSSLPYRLFSYPGLYVIPILSTLALLWIAGRLTRGVMTPRARLLLILALGLTTPLLFYSVVFWDHTLVSLLALLALSESVPRDEEPTLRHVAVAGVALGLAVWFRPEMVLALPSVAVALVRTDRSARGQRLVSLAAGALGALVPFLVFNRLAYGAAVGPHVVVASRVTYPTRSLSEMLRSRIDWAAFLLAPPWRGALLAIGVLFALRWLGWTASSSLVRRRLLLLSAVVLAGLGVALLARPADGLETTLLVTAPLVCLWLLPAPEPSPERPRASNPPGNATELGLGLFGTCYVLLAFLAGLPNGGNQWGPRLLLPAVAPLLIAGALRVTAWRRRDTDRWTGAFVGAALVLLAAAGLHSELRGLRAVAAKNEEIRQFAIALEGTGQRVVVCSDTIVPKLLAPVFYRGYLMFRAETPDRLARFLPHLQAHGIRRFAVIDRPEQPLLAPAPERTGILVESGPRPLPKGYQLTVVRVEEGLPAGSPDALRPDPSNGGV